MKKIMNYKAMIVIFFLFLFSFLILNQTIKTKNTSLNACGVSLVKNRIAACPTFHKYLRNLDQDIFDVYFTNSSSESFYLLENNQVDLILSGRTLKLDENFFPNKVLGDYNNYYSFLSANTKTIYLNELNFYNFYTDLDRNKVKKDLGIEEIEEVENVYNFLNDGIVITSWERTDFSKSEMVHVLKEDDSRLELSRIPIIYYKEDCDLNIIMKLINAEDFVIASL